MNDALERNLLDLKFRQFAEKADTMEKKIAFCESFLKKYKPQPAGSTITDAVGNPTYYSDNYQQGTFPILPSTISSIKSSGEIVSALISVPNFELKQQPELMVFHKKDVVHGLIEQIVKSDKIVWNTFDSPHMDTKEIRAKLGVFKP